MSKLVCECGNVISCVQHPCPHESVIVPEGDMEYVAAEVGKVCELLSKLKGSDRQDWILNRFGDAYPADASDAEIFEDVMTKELTDKARFMLTCPSCGRLHLQQQPGASEYRSFVPSESR